MIASGLALTITILQFNSPHITNTGRIYVNLYYCLSQSTGYRTAIYYIFIVTARTLRSSYRIVRLTLSHRWVYDKKKIILKMYKMTENTQVLS